jgi:hypothetical protein
MLLEDLPGRPFAIRSAVASRSRARLSSACIASGSASCFSRSNMARSLLLRATAAAKRSVTGQKGGVFDMGKDTQIPEAMAMLI